MSDGKKKPKLKLSDLGLAFRRAGKKTSSNAEGFSGISRQFDFIVQKARRTSRSPRWNRTIGVNVIINLDTASADVGPTHNDRRKFSDHAKSYSTAAKSHYHTPKTNQQPMLKLNTKTAPES